MSENPDQLHLYAQADGDVSGLGVANELAERFHEFVVGTRWTFLDPVVINQREPACNYIGVADHPLWEVGLSAEIRGGLSSLEPAFPELAMVATFCADLGSRTGLEFVIGVANATTGISEDLHHIRPGEPEIERLRAIFLGFPSR